MWNKILDIVPGILTIPLGVCALAYAVFLPDTVYYALGIYLGLWFPLLTTFWGYLILFLMLMIPGVNIVLLLLLTFQSFHVLIKYVLGMYDPSLHGLITMYPASAVILVFIFSLLLKKDG